jgi:hypothetical protein
MKFILIIIASISNHQPSSRIELQGDPTGSKDSLIFSYITCNVLTIPLHALKRKRWAVFCSSLIHLITWMLLPIVVTEMVGSETDGNDEISQLFFHAVYYWTAVEFLATVLLLTGILIRVLSWRLSSRKL